MLVKYNFNHKDKTYFSKHLKDQAFKIQQTPPVNEGRTLCLALFGGHMWTKRNDAETDDVRSYKGYRC